MKYVKIASAIGLALGLTFSELRALRTPPGAM